jgi:hypothetical protein
VVVDGFPTGFGWTVGRDALGLARSELVNMEGREQREWSSSNGAAWMPELAEECIAQHASVPIDEAEQKFERWKGEVRESRRMPLQLALL